MVSTLISLFVMAAPNHSLGASPRHGSQDAIVETREQKDRRMAWWREARFGMFIHWGLYAVPGGYWKGKAIDGAGEWLLTDAQIPVADYEPLREQFNPVKFNARKWVRIAKQAGMRYIVITSKHHEGFGLWPSKQSDWNIGFTPFHRDVLKELAKACKQEGIRLCFYHSIMDWHHPDYLPRRPWDHRDASHADFERYVAYMKAQLKELLTNYGDIGILWFDGEWESTWTHERGKDLYSYVRSLQPNIIVNNRVDTGRTGMAGATAPGDFVGDYGTPEQTIPANGIPGTDWESCMTMNDTWGYKIDDHNWKSSTTLIENLVDCASKGGNYLLNVGPTPLGEIPPASVERLAAVGSWMKKNHEAIYGTSASPFPRPLSWGRVTQRPGHLYFTVFKPDVQTIDLPGLKANITAVYPLGSRRRSLKMANDANVITITLPKPTGNAIRVFEADVSGPIEVAVVPLRQMDDGSLELKASTADVLGSEAQYESGKDCIGFWTNANDAVEWSFEASHLGPQKVSIELACEDASAGSTFDVAIGAQHLTGTVPRTGGWTEFKKIDLGEVNLDSLGPMKVKVSAVTKPGAAVMNLRDILLTPAR